MKGRKVQEDLELRKLRKTISSNRKVLSTSIAVQVGLLCVQLSCLEPYRPLLLYAAVRGASLVLFEYWADALNYRVCKARLELREHLAAVTCLAGYLICTSQSSPGNEVLTTFASLVLLPMVAVCSSDSFGLPSQLCMVLHLLLACSRFWEDLWGAGGQQLLGLMAFHALLFKVGMDRVSASRSDDATRSIIGTLSFMLSIICDGYLIIGENERIIGANEGVDVCLGTETGSDGSGLQGKSFSTVFDEKPRSGLNAMWFTRPDSKRVKLEMYTVPCRLSPDGVIQVLDKKPRKDEAGMEPGSCICAFRIADEEKSKDPEPKPVPAPAHHAPDLTQLRLAASQEQAVGVHGPGPAFPSANISPAGSKTLAPLFFKSPWRFESLGSGQLPSRGAYKKIEVHGQEGRGGVNLAEKADGERVAIKEISLSGMSCQRDFPLHLKAISREADALKKMSWASPVVIRLNDCWLQNDFTKACLVTEWLPLTLEGTLTKLRHDSVLSVGKQDARRWFSHMVAGIAAIHAAGFVHRDIKPSNIWMTEDRQRCKIAGLGISRPLQRKSAYSHSKKDRVGSLGSMGSMDFDDTESAVGSTLSEDNCSMVSGFTSLTCFSVLNGVNAYSSPEMVRERRYTEQTDIFSLGCVMLEMLTLAPLAELRIQSQEDSPEEMAWSLVADVRVQCFEVEDSRALSVNSSDLAGVVVTMLSLDPTLRPSAADIISRSARLQTYLPELLEESPKLRGVLLKRQRRVHFNPGVREQEEEAEEDDDGVGSCVSSSVLLPAVA
mmetsp:Transcript_84850/g.262690  ORF Transcript_84850/g.262690 Transcript_84850/m.262690 type:complete len:778 (-) Transcript_84850:227-2560(-)